MKKKELTELMTRKGWNRTRLASELRLTENAVQRWFMAGEAPDGPTSILLHLWLREARGEIRIVEIAKPEPVPA